MLMHIIHGPLWGCQEYNERGNALSEYLATTELEIVNRGCEHMFCSGNKRSVINITIATRSLLVLLFLHDWPGTWTTNVDRAYGRVSQAVQLLYVLALFKSYMTILRVMFCCLLGLLVLIAAAVSQ